MPLLFKISFKALTNTQDYPFLASGGRMGTYARDYNWAASPIGEPEGWPGSLRTLTQMVLASALPMAVFWGQDLVALYNDAFRDCLQSEDMHISLFGKQAVDNAAFWRASGISLNAIMAGSERVDSVHISFGNAGLPPLNCYFSPLTDDSYNLSGVLLTCTPPAVNNDQLEISEQRFQNLVSEASVGIIMLSGPEMVVEIVNNAYAKLISRTVDELHGKALFDVIPEARQVFHQIIEQVRTTGEAVYLYTQPYYVNVKGERKEGFLDLTYQPYKEYDGQVTGVIILCQDVTPQVVARRELEKSEAHLRSIVASAPFPIGVYVGAEMRIALLNQSIIDVWGKGPIPEGKRYSEVLPELAGTGIYEQLDQVYRTGQPFRADNQKVELVIDGQLQPFYFKYSFTPLFDSDGNVYGVMNTAADVTDLVVAQQNLQEAEDSLLGAIELARLGSWELDIATGQANYSETMRSWFGLGDWHGSLEDGFASIHPMDLDIVSTAIRNALDPGSDGIFDAEYRLSEQVSGINRVVHARGKVVFNADGEALKLVGSARDVTEERQRQEALESLVSLRTEELAAANEELATQNEEYMAVNEELEEANQLLIRSNENLQQFAYVASHDLQEPLRKIQQFGDLLKRQYAGQIDDGLMYLQRMQLAASRMSRLIEDLLNFSSISTHREDNQPVALNTVIDQVLGDFEMVIAETGAEIQVDQLPTIPGNALQLGQLFQNLLSNALKFHRPDVPPLIIVRSRTLLAADVPPAVKPTRNTEMYHQIDVIDNGIGFDEQYLERIFQVFQRLHGKNQFSGTGIGLSICAKVMDNHGGTITAVSQPDQGATFKLYFPV